MGRETSQFLTFLDQIYGHETVEQIARLSGLDEKDLAKASEVFVPTFLAELMKSFGSGSTQTDRPAAALFQTADPASGNAGHPNWPQTMADAMADLLKQGADSAQTLAGSGQKRSSGSPMDLLAEQKSAMESLYQVFMGQIAQAKLMEDARRTTGLSSQQLSTLFPLLTTFGLLPLSAQMMLPAMDDPAGWMDYWGDFARKSFRQANRDLDAMPSPLHAAFGGLFAGLYPDAAKREAAEQAEHDPAKEVREASLELQAQYLKGLRSLFEHYQTKMSGS